MGKITDELAKVATDAPKDRDSLSPALLLFLILALFGIFFALLTIFLEGRDAPVAQPTFNPAPQRALTNFRAPRLRAAAAGRLDAGLPVRLRRATTIPQLLGDLVRALRAGAAGAGGIRPRAR